MLKTEKGDEQEGDKTEVQECEFFCFLEENSLNRFKDEILSNKIQRK